MSDIRIVPSSGVIQFSGSSNQIAMISVEDATQVISAGITISSSADIRLNSDANIVASGSFILSSSVSTNPFIIIMDKVGGTAEKFKINSEGITVLGEPITEPTAVEGGIYYSSSHFYFGDGN